MVMSMMGGTGMGAAGTGMGSSPAMPAGAGGLSPQLMALLAQMGGTGAGFTPPGGPMPGQSAGTPMSAYLGAMGGMPQGGGGMAPHPMGGAPPPSGGPQGVPPGGVPSAAQMGAPQIQALIQQLKGGQGGVPATPPQLNPAQNPNSTMPSGTPPWLQSLMGSFGAGGLPPGAGPAGGLT
jgi:hypothetical protein